MRIMPTGLFFSSSLLLLSPPLLLLLLSIVISCQGQPSASVPSRVNVSYSFTIASADYETSTTLEEILASPNGTFQLKFGLLPGQSNPHSLGIVHAASNILVWYTYRNNNPGQYDNLGGSSTSLTLQSDGDLRVTVQGPAGLDVLVWHTATAGLGVTSMALLDEGNLVLRNSSQGIVWQSFDHPTDTLLSGQRLLLGASLLGPARNGYPSIGRNQLTLEPSRLACYVVYVEAEPYWELASSQNQTLAYAAIVNSSICVFDGQDRIVGSVGNVSQSPATGALQRFMLETDGNLRLYEYVNNTNSWTPVLQVIQEACALPDDCGYYGMCIPGQACGCPPTFNLLSTLNGCVPPRGLDCNSKYGKDFVHVPHASYFALSHESPPALTFKACQSLCTSNCSCLGFFYASQGGSSRPCLITHQLRTFTASVYGNYSEKYAYDLYVRVQGKPKFPLAIILGVCIPVAVIVFCLLLWRFVRFRVKVAHAEEEEFLLQALPGLPPRYSYKELKNATKGFSQRMGGGSFGSVYEGVLADGTKIAVKQLEGAMQGKKEFHAEVATIGTVRHLNLVRLRGFCLERNHRLLVYDNMARGSLDGLLFKVEGKENLSWEERLRVAAGVARGLAYLHEGSPDCIIHCDIKPENILVDEEGEAKLSDFGLAKLMSRQLDAVETIVRGTRGYLAPEWLVGRGQISEKADVYSYGVVLLEILSGRRNYDGPSESGKSYVPGWALQAGAEGIHQLLDPALLAEAATWPERREEMRRALLVALWCVQDDPAARPPMSRVARMLEGDADVAEPPLVRPAAEPFYDDTMSSGPPSSVAFDTDRVTASEVTLPFLRRASRFLFFSSSSASTSRQAPLSSLY